MASASLSSQLGGYFATTFEIVNQNSWLFPDVMSLGHQSGFDFVKVKTTSEGDGFSASASCHKEGVFWPVFLCDVRWFSANPGKIQRKRSLNGPLHLTTRWGLILANLKQLHGIGGHPNMCFSSRVPKWFHIRFLNSNSSIHISFVRY